MSYDSTVITCGAAFARFLFMQNVALFFGWLSATSNRLKRLHKPVVTFRIRAMAWIGWAEQLKARQPTADLV